MGWADLYVTESKEVWLTDTLHVKKQFLYTRMSLKSALCGARQGTLWLKWSGFKCLCPSCAALMSISHVGSVQIHFTSFTRIDICIYRALNFPCDIDDIENWDRHLFCALNCAQKSWHSEHDRCWHSELHISLDGICKKTRPPWPLQFIHRYFLPPPAFLCLRNFANLWPR